MVADQDGGIAGGGCRSARRCDATETSDSSELMQAPWRACWASVPTGLRARGRGACGARRSLINTLAGTRTLSHPRIGAGQPGQPLDTQAEVPGVRCSVTRWRA